MTTRQGYRIELSPTVEQRIRLGQHAGLFRVVENFCLELVQAALNARGTAREAGVPDDELPKVPWSAPAMEAAWRGAHPTRYPWFAQSDLSSRVPKEACRVRATALRNFFNSRDGNRKGRKVGFPRWRRRKDGSRFRYDAATAHPISNLVVHLPKVGRVRTREDLSWLTGRLADGRARIIGTTVTEHAGRWWASFQIEIDRNDLDTHRTVPAGAPACGIDLGLKTFAVIANDDGTTEEIHAPKALKASLRKLRRANKALARKEKGSANRVKARLAVAAVHLKVANQRGDFLHQTTTRLARTKRTIVVEDLNVAGMVRNRSLARAISDAGFAEFRRQLEYKTTWYGSTVVVADRWMPSSKTCSECGVVHRGLTLSDRSWVCLCGTKHDRDVNAARNLLELAA